MRKIIFLFGLLVAFAASAMPKVVAHRGYWQTEGSAQNSIRSLVKADSIGCAAVEFDVWITADDVLVLNHNADIDGHVVEKETFAELSGCRLSNGEPLPTLSHYLDVARGLSVDLILELKPHADRSRENAAVERIVKMVEEKGLRDRVSYITFSRNAFDAFVEQSGRPVYYLNGVSPKVLEEIGGMGPDYHINVFRAHPDWIGEFKKKGMPVNIWTVDSEADLSWCIEHGADFVTTNNPALALKLAKEAAMPAKVRVMTYNLRFGELAGENLDALAEFIKAQNPDFVALQEVDVCTSRTAAPAMNGRNMLSELAGKTGMFGYYARTINFAGGYYGIGILSKHPCVETEQFELPNPENAEPRALLKGVFELNGKRKIVFAVTHLDVKSAKTRELQADYICGILNSETIPVVLGGDFNAKPGEEAILTFETNADNLTGEAPTFPSVNPERKLDYLFGFPKNQIQAESVAVGNGGTPLSDHLPVVADIVIAF